MRTAVRKLYQGHACAKAAFCVFCAVFYAALVCWAGGSLSGLGLVLGAAAVYVLAPGWLAMRVSGMAEHTPVLALPLTLLCGTGMLAVCYCFAERLHMLWLLRGVPPVLAACAGLLWLKERRRSPHGPLRQTAGAAQGGGAARPRGFAALLPAPSPAQWLLALLWAGLVFLLAFANVIKYARPSHAGPVLIEQDFLWMVGNAKSFLLAFPSIEIRFYNVRFAYHYLTEMLCAALGIVTGQDCYNILGFYLQPLLLAGMVCCLYCMGRVFYGPGQQGKALLFPFSLFLFSCASLWAVVPNGRSLVGNSTIVHLLTNITSQTTATMYAAIFSCLFLTVLRAHFRVPAVQLAALLASFAMLTVAKGPMALIVGLAALTAIVFQLAQRAGSVRGVLTAAAGAALFWGFYRLLFSASANGSMSLRLTGTLERFVLAGAAGALPKNGVPAVLGAAALWLVQFVLMVPAAAVPFFTSLARDLRHFLRLAPERAFAYAAAGGGTLAYFIFSHPNYSQVYFFLAAVLFVALLAVDGSETLFRGRARGAARRLLRGLGLAGAAAGFATAVLLYVHIGGSGILYFLRDTNVIRRPVYDTMITADDEAAGLWLAQNTAGAGTMFATNRIQSDRGHADGISNVYTAFSGRQAFMEGYAYVADTAPWMWVKERKEVNAALFSAGTDAASLRALCRKYGITHLIFSAQAAGSETQLAAAFPCVYANGSVRIYQVP